MYGVGGVVLQHFAVQIAGFEVEGDATPVAGRFEEYLNGFSANVQEVLGEVPVPQSDSEVGRGGCAGVFDREVLGPVGQSESTYPVVSADESVLVEGLDNHSMGTIFEELIRRFNEENNEGGG